MARSKHEKVDVDDRGASGFGGLGALLRAEGLAASETPNADPAPSPPAPGTRKPGRVILRREKKGRGGKTVTTLTGQGLDPAAREALAKRLRRALGCGAGVEGEAVVIQGDQRDRAAELLEAEGWRVVRG